MPWARPVREKKRKELFEVQVSSMTPGSYEVTVADGSVGTFHREC